MSKFLAEKLRELRGNIGFTQYDLSELLLKEGKKYSTTYLSMIENGISLPTIKLLLSLSKIYDYDVNKLLSLRRKDYLDDIEKRLHIDEAKALNKENQNKA